MAKYICDVCGYEYDPSETGKAFNELPEDWTCPGKKRQNRVEHNPHNNPLGAKPRFLQSKIMVEGGDCGAITG